MPAKRSSPSLVATLVLALVAVLGLAAGGCGTATNEAPYLPLSDQGGMSVAAGADETTMTTMTTAAGTSTTTTTQTTTAEETTAATATTANGPAEPGGGASLDLSGAVCRFTGAPEGVNVTWWELDLDAYGGGTIDLIGNSGVLTTVDGTSEGLITLFGARTEPAISLQLIVRAADGPVGRLGCEQDSAADDSEAPSPSQPEPAQSDPDMSDPDMSDPTLSDPDMSDPALSDPTPSDDAEVQALLAARDRFDRVAFGPHGYLTITIDGTTKDLYLTPTETGGHEFVPPLPDATLVHPFTIHDDLVAAIEAEQEVSFELDESSGLPTRWTVDGLTTTVACFELDTAPPDLRVGRCNPETDLIGR